MKVIDIHAHWTPECFRRAVADGGDFHGMTSADGELENPKNLWSVEERLAEMDALGVDVHAISSTDVFYQYDRPVEVTKAIARECNDELIGIARDHPDRFAPLGTLPMQDAGAAVEELGRIMGEPNVKGVMINDHINGATLDDPRFRPFWRSVEELGALVFFHQFHPTMVSARTTRYMLPNTVGNLADRAVTFGTLVSSGLMDEFPNLKICLAHGGGYAAFGAARMDKGWEAAALDYMPDEPRKYIDRPPSSYLDRFYYDCLTLSEPTLRFLIDQVGVDRVVFGTDFPAPMIQVDAVNWVRGLASLTEGEKEAILSRNPARVLGLEAASSDPRPSGG